MRKPFVLFMDAGPYVHKSDSAEITFGVMKAVKIIEIKVNKIFLNINNSFLHSNFNVNISEVF